MFENVKWIFVQYVGESFSNGFEEYVSEDGKYCKQIWDDGFIEIFKCGQCHNKILSNCIQFFVLDYRMKLQYNIIKKSKGVHTMMIRSNKRKKFSLKYRLEKWFYEDSLNHLVLILKGVGMLLICLIGFALICILPALFH